MGGGGVGEEVVEPTEGVFAVAVDFIVVKMGVGVGRGGGGVSEGVEVVVYLDCVVGHFCLFGLAFDDWIVCFDDWIVWSLVGLVSSL